MSDRTLRAHVAWLRERRARAVRRGRGNLAPAARGVSRAHRVSKCRPALLFRSGRSATPTRLPHGAFGNTDAADYTDDHQVLGGISFPTLRRAVRRAPDATTLPELLC